MPRGRGGARQGVTGKAYANRTDMNGANVVGPQGQNLNAGKIAATAVPGQAYGAAGAQLAGQKAVPMGATSSPVQPASAQAPAANGAPPAPAAPMGPLTPLNAPTNHGLPVTTGLDGQGMMPNLQFDPSQHALTLLNSLGANISPQVSYIRDYLAMQTENQMPH
jgi:hypothetical protein